MSKAPLPHRLPLGLLAITLLVHATIAQADRVVLQNGNELQGIILREDENQIEFMNENRMVMRLQKRIVMEQEVRRTPLKAEIASEKAFEEGKMEEALALLAEAIELGGNETALRARMDTIRDAQIQTKLGDLFTDWKDARQLMQQGRHDQAERVLAEMVKKSSNKPEVVTIARAMVGDICMARARRLVDSVQHAQAETQYLRAAELNPANPQIFEELGDLYSRKSVSHDRAVASYLRALEVGGSELSSPQANQLNLKIAELYSANNYHEFAARHYRVVFNNNPENPRLVGEKLIESLSALAETNTIQNQQFIIESLQEATTIAPENVEIQELLANLLLKSLDYPAAKTAFERVLELRPSRPDANENIAFIYRLDREYALEAEHLAREVVNDPKDYTSKVLYGDALWKLGDYDKSIEQYEAAKALDTENPRALVALASAQRKLGKYKEARSSIQEILNRFENDVRANLEMGLVFLDEKNYRGAEPFFNDTIKLMEEDTLKGTLEGDLILASAHVARGQVALNQTGPGTATADFDKALEILPEYPPAIFSTGEALQKKFSSTRSMNDLEEAEEKMLLARELDEANPDFALGLGIFYHRTYSQEERTRELEHYRSALQHYRDYVNLGGAQIEQVNGFIKELEASEKELENQLLATPTPVVATADGATTQSAPIATADDSTSPVAAVEPQP
jgi:tetratricopeptide (TPR) repeat protein